MTKLNLDWDQIDRCRSLAETIAHPVERYIDMHSTVAIERAVLRLLGFTDTITVSEGLERPLANLVVDALGKDQLKNGVASLLGSLRKKYPRLSQKQLGEKIINREINYNKIEELPHDKAAQVLKPWIDSAYRHLDRMRYKKDEMRQLGPVREPLKHVVVSTGDINSDIEQAERAAKSGADVIAVLRSSGQSLLDYVPSGEISEGHGGTFATAENIQRLREALDDVSHKLKRYVRLAHTTSGLCMPEFAAISALGGVDYAMNDVFYGPLFRDVNIKRAVLDQHFSKILLSRSGTVLNTGEDNVQSHADNSPWQNQWIALQFLNEQFCKLAGIRDDLIGINHQFSMDPGNQDSFLEQLALAQLMRELFPRSPLRMTPAMRYKNGDPLRNQVMDSMFNLLSLMTGQRVQMLGTIDQQYFQENFEAKEASISNANVVFHAARSLYHEIQFLTNGKVMRRARSVMDGTVKFLNRVKNRGLFDAVEQGIFFDVPRRKDGGRGFDGVFAKSRRYYNPFWLSSSGSSER